MKLTVDQAIEKAEKARQEGNINDAFSNLLRRSIKLKLGSFEEFRLISELIKIHRQH